MSAVKKDYFRAGELFFEGRLEGFRFFGRRIGPEKENKDVGFAGIQVPGQGKGGFHPVLSGGNDIFSAESDIVSAAGLGRIADGTGNKAGGNALCRFCEGRYQVFDREFRIQVCEGEITFARSLGGDDLNAGFLIQVCGLPGCKDDVAVVR